MKTRIAQLPFVCLFVFQFGISMASAETRVQFDVSRFVACRNVTADEFARANGDEKLIQARLQVSALVFQGQAEHISECLYRFENPTDTLQPSGAAQVVDYLPRTTMDSNVAGNIRVQRSNEGDKQLSLNVGGNVELAHGSLGASRSKSTRSALEYELLPPQEMVAAVGTTGRGTGVYFKLHRTPQISLEGSRDFVITLRVPANWRGGHLRAACQAMQRSGDLAQTIGSGAFVIPLYLDGDADAKQRAQALSGAENRLYALARRHGEEIRRRSQPTIVHELALADPRIPQTWLYDVLQNAVGHGRHFSFERHLPDSLRQAINEYRLAKQQLSSLVLQSPQESGNLGVASITEQPREDSALPLVSTAKWTTRDAN